MLLLLTLQLLFKHSKLFNLTSDCRFHCSAMKFYEHQEKLEILVKLIDRSCTGSPKELAKKLHTSERTARRLVEQLRDTNKEIIFCRKTNSYLFK